MPENFDLRYDMSKCSTVDAMIEVTVKLRDRMTDYLTHKKEWLPEKGNEIRTSILPNQLIKTTIFLRGTSF